MQIKRLGVLLFLIVLFRPWQSGAMDINNSFHGIVTLVISSSPNAQSQGTVFFYQKLTPDKDPQWSVIEQVWLVTNRHVIVPQMGGKEIFPDEFRFHLRKKEGNTIKWDPIVLTKKELIARTKFHPNPRVDVCAIKVLDLLMSKIKSGGEYLQWYGVSSEQLPGKNNIFMEVADDIAVIGFPRGFYDQVNLYPIVKSGIFASRWGANFNGERYFLIDAKLFPGSSGSIVVSKPKNFVVAGSSILASLDKQFAFLGIYSGEPYFQLPPVEFESMTIFPKADFNLDIVWYGDLSKNY